MNSFKFRKDVSTFLRLWLLLLLLRRRVHPLRWWLKVSRIFILLFVDLLLLKRNFLIKGKRIINRCWQIRLHWYSHDPSV